jgi:hypothetical protein
MKELLVALLAIGFLSAKEPHPGVDRWAIKTSVPEGAKLDHPNNMSLNDLLALKDAKGVTKNERSFQEARIPDPPPGAKVKEGDIISTTGWLHLVAGEDDGDYHIQISASADSGDHCLIVEVPNPDPEFVKTADLRPGFEAVRTFIKARLLKNKEPSSSGSVMEGKAFVRVTGQLFYDDSHVGDQPRGKKGMKAATLWELHPVTAMEFAPRPK